MTREQSPALTCNSNGRLDPGSFALDSLFCMDQATTELISLSQRSLSPSHSRGISGGSWPIPGPGGPSYWLLPADVGCGRCPSVPQTASCSADGEGSREAGPPCILLFCAWAVGSPVKETLAWWPNPCARYKQDHHSQRIFFPPGGHYAGCGSMVP